MNQQKKFRLYEIFAGIGFLLATISYSIGSGMVENAIAQIAEVKVGNLPMLGLGISLELLNSIAVIAIGILLFFRLKQKSKPVMFGYLLSRIVESVLLGTGSLLALSQISEPLNIHNLFFNIAMIILGIYSVIFCVYLVKWTIRTKWMFIIGVIGYGTLIIYAAINLVNPAQPAPMWLFGPGAVFEIIFPVWLIARGFITKFKSLRAV